MAFENRQDVDLILQDAIDDSIATLNHLTKIVTPELGDPTPGTRHLRCLARLVPQPVDPPARGAGFVTSNIATDVEKIVTRPFGPTQPQGPSSASISVSSDSSSRSLPACESASPAWTAVKKRS